MQFFGRALYKYTSIRLMDEPLCLSVLMFNFGEQITIYF